MDCEDVNQLFIKLLDLLLCISIVFCFVLGPVHCQNLHYIYEENNRTWIEIY